MAALIWIKLQSKRGSRFNCLKNKTETRVIQALQNVSNKKRHLLPPPPPNLYIERKLCPLFFLEMYLSHLFNYYRKTHHRSHCLKVKS